MTPPLVIPPYLKQAPLTGLIGMGGGATSRHFYTASSSDSYQIGKSLRFSEDDDAYLSRHNPENGNRKTWTLNFWYKRTLTGGQGSSDYIFGCGPDANNTVYVYMDSTTLRVYSAEGGTNDTSMTTNQTFRDAGAWQMHTLSIDTTHPTETERLRYWINGEQITSWSNANYPSQGADLQVNKNVNHYFGRTNDGSTDPLLDAYLSDVYLIDGIALNPASFGSKDSTGAWNPKTFSPPVVNNGTTWSSSLYTSNSTYDNTTTATNFATGDEADEGFLNTSTTDGSVEAGTNYSGGDLPAWIYFRPATSIENVSTIRVRTRYAGTIRVNDVDTFTGTASIYPTWVPIPRKYVPTTLTSIAVQSTTGNARISGIEINGVVLVDGKTDIEETVGTGAAAIVNVPSTTFPFVDSVTQGFMGSGANMSVESAGTNSFGLGNVGVYDAISDNISCSETSNVYGNPWTIDTYMKFDSMPSATSYWTGFDADNASAVYCIGMTSTNKFAFWQTAGGNNVYDDVARVVDTWYHIRVTRDLDDKIRMWINGTEAGEGSEDAQTVGSSAGDFRIGNWYGSSNGGLSSFRGNIGPTRLVAADLGAPPSGGLETTSGVLPSYVAGVHSHTFHLKFDDTAADKNIGYSQMMNTPTGAQPMYGNGADDTNTDNLVFAFPGYDLEDHHHTIKGSGSAKALTINGNTAVDTTYSRFYGSSTAFDGTGDYISNSSSTSDFTMGTGDFTVECWASKSSATSHTGFWQISGTAGGLTSSSIEGTLAVGYYSSGGNTKWQWYGGGGGGSEESDQYPITANAWYHIAYVRSSGVAKLYINGKAVMTRSSDTTDYQGTYVAIGGYYSTSYLHNGNIQDFRIYKGVAKYTADFTIPVRNDFTVNNLTAAADGKVYTSGNTWNYKTFDGLISTAGGTTPGNTQELLTNQSITVTSKIELYNNDGVATTSRVIDGDGNTYQIKQGGGSNGSPHWGVLYNADSQSGTNYTGTLTGPVYLKGGGSSHYYAIRVDGTIITDSSYGDVSTDTPSNGGEDTGVGGEVTGNFCTWDPRANLGGLSLSQGNLRQYWAGSGWKSVLGTMSVSGGKWYYEYTCEQCETTPDDHQIGWADVFDDGAQSTWANYGDRPGDQKAYVYYNLGNTRYNSTSNDNSGYASWLTGDVIGVALDLDNGKIFFAKNGTWQGSSDPAAGTNAAYTSVSTTTRFTPVVGNWSNGSQKRSGTVNFGQRTFLYTAPTGFKAVCTANLNDTFSGDNANNPSNYFDITKYTGNGDSTNGNTISGLGFQPDLVWIKRRDTATSHMVYDAIRGFGVNKAIIPNANYIEGDTSGVAEATHGFLDAVTSDGFTVKAGSSSGVYTNTDDSTYVAWNWDAGTAAATPSTSGTVTPDDQWVNDAAGFSITKYEVPATSTFTVGHGLSAAPHFILQKCRNATNNWDSYHIGVGPTKRTKLNTNDSSETHGGVWNDTAPTSTVFSQKGNGSWYAIGDSIITYCWRPIAGYSHFGYYSGNADSDGPRLYFGFRPRFILIKGVDAGTSWVLLDSERDGDGSNPMGTDTYLKGDTNEAENVDGAHNWGDFLSDGFKHNASGSWHNGSGYEYFYAAWAENPFKTARSF